MRPRVYANYHAQWMISRPKSVTPLQGPQSDLTPSDHLKVHFIIHSSIECMKRHENWDSCQVRKCIFNRRISMYRINIHYTYYILTYDRNEYVNWWRRDSWANVTGLALLLTRRDCMEVASWSRSLSLTQSPGWAESHLSPPGITHLQSQSREQCCVNLTTRFSIHIHTRSNFVRKLCNPKKRRAPLHTTNDKPLYRLFVKHDFLNET